MTIIDKQFISFDYDGESIKVVVYLKYVSTQGGSQVLRAFCKKVDPAIAKEYRLQSE